MIKTIVTGVDDSETAAAAARRAGLLAASTGAKLYVISAFGNQEDDTVEVSGEKVRVNYRHDAETVAFGVAEELRREFAGIDVTARAALGQPDEAILAVAAEVKADLIVVGNKRVQGIQRVLGSIGRNVLGRARCDVYIAYTT